MRVGKRSRKVAERRTLGSDGEPRARAPERPLVAPRESPGLPGGAAGAGGRPAGGAALQEALRALRGAQRRRVAADRDLGLAVRAMRRAGASWHVVGQAVGMTAEGARKRFTE